MNQVSINPLEALIERFDEAVATEKPESICQGVKQALIDFTTEHPMDLPPHLLTTTSDKYARHLLHKDPQGRYSVVVMVWGPGQGTALHDHAGQWCVEGVYQGKIRVRSFELDRQEGDICHFTPQTEAISDIGEAGMLIPPFEHHILENPFDNTAITIHVYSQELTWCHCFTPVSENTYRQERVELCYTE